jgi:hypothetical protein
MKKNKTNTPAAPGLIVPINVAALCVGNDTQPIFEQTPYDFTQLPTSDDTEIPNISETVMTGDNVNLKPGIHLHWALPDALTHGVDQEGTGAMTFPPIPDRWLVTRIYTNLSNPAKPTNEIKSWVVESNYLSTSNPDPQRESITVPYLSNEPGAQPYRYMGRVSDYEDWITGIHITREDVTGLSAIGYGIPEFSAFYQTCHSVLGFYDTGADLAELGNPGTDRLLAYHVVGWYSVPDNDPLRQPPGQFQADAFNQLLAKITNSSDKTFIQQMYPQNATTKLYVLKAGISSADKEKIWSIFTAAGYDFLDHLLETFHWSLPSGTALPSPQPDHTLCTGTICHITWNEDTDYFKPITGDINIAVGNTPSEALAALIANMPGLEGQPAVELILDALQQGLLAKVTDVQSLDQWEELKMAIHQSSFGSTHGDYLWEIQLKSPPHPGAGEPTLPDGLAEDLNQLNIDQQEYNDAQYQVESMRWQIFSDWYRFMQVSHRDTHDPSHGLNDGDISDYIEDQIDKLNDKVKTTTLDNVNKQIKMITPQLGDAYVLKKISAPRYWHANEPVVLFQGENITPPERYGGDGRYMYNNSLVCRLAMQALTSLTIAPEAVGNPNRMVYNESNLPGLKPAGLPYMSEIQKLFTESCLLGADVIAAELNAGGVPTDFKTLVSDLQTARDRVLTPPIFTPIADSEFREILSKISGIDQAFLKEMYKEEGGNWVLTGVEHTQLTPGERRLQYIFISTAYQPDAQLVFAGIAPSVIALDQWAGTPWLPFSLKWEIYYYPLENINTDSGIDNNYPMDFITSNFKLADVNLEYSAGQKTLKYSQPYSNTIFLTPHAGINFKKQLEDFISKHAQDPLYPELQTIVDKMGDLSVLSQALSGFNDALTMRRKVMQLEVGDPAAAGFSKFTNTDVKNAVEKMNIAAPSPGVCYNPIRSGLINISDLYIVDIFGRNIEIKSPNMIYRAENMKEPQLSDTDVYLSPRVTQPARFLFRWLSANHDKVEMNSHPATTPVCGWVLCNHLDSSLWIYDNKGNAYGSLILNGDSTKVIWQCVPGGSAFGKSITEFFNTTAKNANKDLKAFAIALYNNGEPGYLRPFMRALDKSSSLIEPQNYKQQRGSAVLMGQPLALVRASLTFQLQGLPAYNQSWTDFKKEVDGDNNGQSVPRSDNKFTQVQFPVRAGAMAQAGDGMVGYFKAGDYSHFYALAVADPSSTKVTVPTDDNITLSFAPPTDSTTISMLVNPRGKVHATTGIFPVKAIDIPPDQYVDALKRLELTFLTSPVVSSASRLAFPMPGESGGNWSWIENEKTKWSETKKIAKVNDKATMSYSPQEIS